jgi:hypothetical protein
MRQIRNSEREIRDKHEKKIPNLKHQIPNKFQGPKRRGSPTRQIALGVPCRPSDDPF